MPKIRKSEVPAMLAGERSYGDPEQRWAELRGATPPVEQTRKPGLFEDMLNSFLDPYFLYDQQGIDMHRAANAPRASEADQFRLQQQQQPGLEQSFSIPEDTFVRRNANGDLELALALNRNDYAPGEGSADKAMVGLGHLAGMGSGAEALGPGGPGATAIMSALANEGPQVSRAGEQMGTFFGASAPRAPLSRLPKATELLEKGYDPKDVWHLYGWAPSPTSEMMWELPDDAARLHPDILNEFAKAHDKDLYSKFTGQLQDLLIHPELIQNLSSELRTVPTTVIHNPHAPSQGRGFMMSDASTPPGTLAENFVPTGITSEGNNVDDILSVLLHETQHGVQGTEGRLYRVGGPAYIKGMILDAIGRSPNPQPTQKLFADQMAWDIYKRQASEVEARNVQARQRMNIFQRREKAPFVTQDVPTERQLLGFSPQISTDGQVVLGK